MCIDRCIHTMLFENYWVRALLSARRSSASELIQFARHAFPEHPWTSAASYEAENVPAATDAVHTNQLGGPARQIHNFVFKLNTWRPTEDLLLRQKVRWLWEGSPCFAFISTFYRHQAQVIQSKSSIVGIPLHHYGRGRGQRWQCKLCRSPTHHSLSWSQL